MDNRDHKSPQHPESDKSFLGVGKAGVFKRKGGTRKDLLGIGKIKTVNRKIGRAFRVVPSEANLHNVYTLRWDV